MYFAYENESFLLITLLAYSMLGSNMSKWNLHSNDYRSLSIDRGCR